MGEPIRILHLISGLHVGGAETMVLQLVSETQGVTASHFVISMTDIGEIGERLQMMGVPVESLGMRRRTTDIRGMLRFNKWLSTHEFDVVHSWMYHANLLAGLLVRKPLVWAIHNTDLSLRFSGVLTVLTNLMCAILSHFCANQVVYCAESARVLHEKQGYDRRKGLVIPNGFDLDQFKPDTHARQRLLERLNLRDTPELRLVGHVGRFNPQKDYGNLVSAFSRVCHVDADAHLVLFGNQLEESNRWLTERIVAAGVGDRVHLMGRTEHIETLLPGLDVFVLSSAYGEAFPLALGEAMACGVACVSTDVGDARVMLSNAGKVVPPKDPVMLAEAILALLTQSPNEIQRQAEASRRKIMESYDIHAVIDAYLTLYHSLCIR
ncbi:MAG: glycosyltransferase [Anaerolineae bacterium]|nr:glycosyltransferase [Anaerolineae bacterium]